MKILLANILWFLSTIPDTIRFAIALRHPAKAQKSAARKRRPTTEGDITLYEPTSGTTGGTKWIPYTEQLRREFMRAVNPWMASLYLRHPRMFLSTHYWAISPSTRVRSDEGGKRRGFAEDREYLGSWRCRITSTLFPVPASVADEHDPVRHRFATARALLPSRRLGIISVWHPSAFLRLLDFMSEHADELATGKLRDDLKARSFDKVWPRLSVISCWNAAFARRDAAVLHELFPDAELEGKGLMATEGVVSFPWFGRRVAAITSHNLAFEPVGEDGEPEKGARQLGVEELAAGGKYGVIITTGNGYSDYRLGDVVECTGFVGRTPRLEFLYRSGGWVDLHGEKMSQAFAQEVIERLGARSMPRFAQFSARDDGNGYELRWEPSDGIDGPSAEEVETELTRNYHYAHARNLGQLDAVRVIIVRNGLAEWCRAHGISESAAKVPPLQPPISPKKMR